MEKPENQGKPDSEADCCGPKSHGHGCCCCCGGGRKVLGALVLLLVGAIGGYFVGKCSMYHCAAPAAMQAPMAPPAPPAK